MRKGIDENFLCSLFKSTANNRIECIDQIKFHSLLTIFEFTVKKTSEQKNFRFIEKMYNSFRQIIWTIIGFMVIIQLIEQQPSVQCGGGGGGGDQHSATTPHHNQPSHPRFLCPAQHGRFACRIDPKKYYLCDNFVPFLLDCPGTLFFDKTIKDCKSAGHFVLGTTAKPKH
ncbi:uncharacterized protein LOC142597696 [Dermatophagoides farinae]|uniref:uncharacterized protein LOC142597696 n=1 Tax=Dermatophagoides farinae TaxID=6954 RepID=UPI003F5EE68E